MSPLISSPETQIEFDLLELLSLPDVPYPWNPLCPACEGYLNTKESDFYSQEEEMTPELIAYSDLLFSHLEHLWSTVSLQQKLTARFANSVPENLLERIIKSVEKIRGEYESLGEQMVKSVSEIFPQWSEEDLQVLARPFVYVMREANPETEEIFSPDLSWEKLSEIEQARRCLQVCYYAIDFLQNSEKS